MTVIERLKSKLPDDFDWNVNPHPFYPQVPFAPPLEQILQTKVDDEGPRDGLQGVEHFPEVPQMKEYIRRSHDLGIRIMTVGIATRRDAPPYKLTRQILPFMDQHYPDMTPIIIVRPDLYDHGVVQEFADLNDKTQALIYKAAAPRRVHVERWKTEQVINDLANSSNSLGGDGIPTIVTLEDATRTPPETIKKFINRALENGANRICFADTVGDLDPGGTARFTIALRSMINRHAGGENIGIDAHFHNDRGFAFDNMLVAAKFAGNNARIHGTPFSIGERAGNGALELFMYNMQRFAREAGHEKNLYELKYLVPWAQQYSVISGRAIPEHAPLVGDNIDKTGAGPHANAYREIDELIEQIDWNKPEDAEYGMQLIAARNTIFTSVNLAEIGRKPRFFIGAMSGAANVIETLMQQGYLIDKKDKTQPIIGKLLDAAYTRWRALTNDEIDSIVGDSLPKSGILLE